ncbi:MAG: GCN5-related N-acetyltransferase [Gemmatimonadetes bacterium]|nr:GCN5-related N-acetyltransferase [Gemmatimonadota bacterium]
MAPREVERTYLELRSRDALRVTSADLAQLDGLRLTDASDMSVSEYRALYALIGDRWHWHDRNAWSDARLGAHLASLDVATWTLSDHAGPLGYFELSRWSDGTVEILYFGLAERAMGRRLGAALLARAVEECWKWGAARVELNTCTLDSPRALPNYLARGFSIVRSETYLFDG